MCYDKKYLYLQADKPVADTITLQRQFKDSIKSETQQYKVYNTMNTFLRNTRILAVALLSIVGAISATAQTQEGDTATWAVPVASVVNIRGGADYSAEMETQALLGMPMKIVENGRWIKVMTPDGDTGYVLESSVKRMTDAEMHEWNAAKQIIVSTHTATVYAQPDAKSPRVSDVVTACRLKLLGRINSFFHVALPDGREGYIPTVRARTVENWRKTVKHNAENIIATGLSLCGLPYQWGGTSVKAVDCSGFVRTTFLIHDVTLPRNASQQAKVGQHIDIAPDFSNLEPGDLVFFGRKATDDKPAHVSHVGIYIGNKKFVHSLAWVHVSSFDPADPEYDEYDLNRLLWAQRVLPLVNTIPEVTTNDRHAFYTH